jgi:hypothetical protein
MSDKPVEAAVDQHRAQIDGERHGIARPHPLL